MNTIIPGPSMSDEEFDWNSIEPGIRDVVCFLKERKFDTFASCEGGPNHSSNRPWVRVGLSKSNDLSGLRFLIAHQLIKGGYRGFTIREHYEHQSSAKCDTHSFIEIEFWMQKPVIPDINMEIEKRF